MKASSILKQVSQEAILLWKADWIKRQAKNSLHSEAFWYEIVNLLLDGRLQLGNNPLVPIGNYVFDWPGAMEYLVERNNRGIDLEKSGNIESAITIYELGVADEFFGTHPYDRFRIFYGRKQWYKDAIRVCQSYLNLPTRPNGQDKSHFKKHLEKLLTKRNNL